VNELGSVSALRRYPVKSMLGEDLERASLIDAGVVGDRAMALIDVATGNVASAKHPKLWRGLLQFAARWHEGDIEISFPEGMSVSVRDPRIDELLTARVGRVVRLTATRPPNALLGRPAPEDVIAAGDDADVPYELIEIGGAAPGSTFVDYAPIHVVTTATLRHVGAEMIRYRPNIVIDNGDSPPFVENDWPGRTITLGDARLRFILATPRCAVPTLAHGALARNPDAVRALLEHNRITLPDRGLRPCLGAYAQVEAPASVTVNDRAVLD
jgi:uncharacterized protein YcbX